MNTKPAQKTSKLGTKLTFTLIDMRGQNNFPRSQQGFVYEYLEQRVIRCKYTGCNIKRDARYVIRTDDNGWGWRIDLLPKLGPAETVYGIGTGRPTHWFTAKLAAEALVGVLDEIAHNSSLAA